MKSKSPYFMFSIRGAVVCLLLSAVLASVPGFYVDEFFQVDKCTRYEYIYHSVNCLGDYCVVTCFENVNQRMNILVNMKTQEMSELVDIRGFSCWATQRYLFCSTKNTLKILNMTHVIHSISTAFSWIPIGLTKNPMMFAFSAEEEERLVFFFDQDSNMVARMSFNASNVTQEFTAKRMAAYIDTVYLPRTSLSLLETQQIFDKYISYFGADYRDNMVIDLENLFSETNSTFLSSHIYRLIFERNTFGRYITSDHMLYVDTNGWVSAVNLTDPLILNHTRGVINSVDYKVGWSPRASALYVDLETTGSVSYYTDNFNCIDKYEFYRYDVSTDTQSKLTVEADLTSTLPYCRSYGGFGELFSDEEKLLVSYQILFNNSHTADKVYLSVLRMANCSASSCENCSMDPIKCKWCVEDSDCLYVTKNCSTDVQAIGADECPAVDRYAPTLTYVEKEFNFTVEGQLYIDSLENKTLTLEDGGSLQVDLLVGSNSSALFNFTVGSEQELTLGIYKDGRRFILEDLSLVVLNCSTRMTCESCWDDGCFWCEETSTCGDNCTSNVSNCPTINAQPSILPAFSQKTVSVNASNMYINATQCAFVNATGLIYYVAATRISDEEYTCVSPIVDLFSPNETFSLFLAISGGEFVTNAFDVEFVSCYRASTCAECITESSKEYCGWCSLNKTCEELTVGESCSRDILVNESCPVAQPSPSSYYEDGGGIAYLLGGFFYDPSPYEYTVWWPSASVSVNATFINTSALSFVVPGVVSGFYDMWLNLTGDGASPGGEYVDESIGVFEWYNCSATGSGCDSCILYKEDNHEMCAFCFYTECNLSSVCTSNVALNECPILLSVEPDLIHVGETPKLTVTVSAVYNVSGYTYECEFPVGTTSAVFINETTIECELPYFSTSGVYNLQILVNSMDYSTSSLPITVYTCSDYDSSCEDCLSHSDFCTFCLFDICIETVSADVACNSTVNVTSCPIASSISPSDWYVYPSHEDPVNVTLEGEFYLSSFTAAGGGSVNVTCDFPTIGIVIPSISVNDTHVVCFAHEGIAYDIDAVSKDVDVDVVVNDTFVIASKSIEYYDCSYGGFKKSCGECQTHNISRCGWCYSSGECVQIETCSSTHSFVQTGCVDVSSASIDYARVDESTNIAVLGSSFFDSDFLVCTFEKNATYSLKTTATYVNSSRVLCPTPVISNSELGVGVVSSLFSLFLSFVEVRFSSVEFPIELLSCDNVVNYEYTCESCLSPIEPRCAWCLDASSNLTACLPDNACGSPSRTVVGSNATCPFISNVEPSQVTFGAPVVLRVTGTHFFNSTLFECRIGGYSESATFVSSSILDCVSPNVPQSLASGGVMSTSLKIFYSGYDFTPENSLTLTYVVPPDDNTGLKVLVTLLVIWMVVLMMVFAILIVVILILIIVIIVTGLVIYKTRKGGYDVELVPPEFKSVPFVLSNKPLHDFMKDTRRQLMILENVILDDDFGLLFYISDILKPEERDKFPKALIPLSMSNQEVGDPVTLINSFITQEIELATNVGTLFRENSMATKLFSEYVKIVGLEYLWAALAVPLYNMGQKFNPANQGEDAEMEPLIVEINPSKMSDETLEMLNANTYELLYHASKIFLRLKRFSSKVPRGIRRILVHTEHELMNRYPEAIYKGIGGLFFLRFVCPALSLPHIYGLLSDPPAPQMQRALILLTKVLQNLANETLPGAKEEYMKKLDPFVNENLDAYHELLDSLLDMQSLGGAPDIEVPIPKYTRENARFTMFEIANNHEWDLSSQFPAIGSSLNNLREVL